jgi:Kef-type K+ transport system membrane component KefB
VDLSTTIDTLLAIAAVAAAAPLLLALLPWLRVPQVVILIAGGVLIGPEVLDLGTPSSVQVLSDLGLGFVFLLAGYEVDVALFRSSSGRRAIVSWFISVTVAVVALAEIGRRNGTMLPENQAALVGAGVLSVLILPSAAIALHKRRRAEPDDSASENPAPTESIEPGQIGR